VVILLVGLSICPAISSGSDSRELKPLLAYSNYESIVLARLKPLLAAANYGARLNYRGKCVAVSTDNELLPDQKTEVMLFPKLTLQGPPTDSGGAAAIRALFQRGQSVAVKQLLPDVVQINIGDVPDALLQTKISDLTLSPMEQYNPILLMGAIIKTREMEAALKRLKTIPLMVVDNYSLVDPAEGLPHLPAIIRGMTIGQIFDQVASVFKIPVIYGACENPGIFNVDMGTAPIYANVPDGQ
jgi:hypothetical protein